MTRPVSSRKSLPLLSTPMVPETSLEINMLREDFYNQVVPYRDTPKPYSLSVCGAPSHTIESGLMPAMHRPGGVDHFVRDVASTLLRNQHGWLEIVIEDETSSPFLFRVCHVIGVRCAPDGRVIQEIPENAEFAEWFQSNSIGNSSINLDPASMIHVAMPEDYPGQLIRRLFLELGEIRTLSMPDWAVEHVVGVTPDSPFFDVNEASRTHRLRTLQAALPIGWTARESLRVEGRQVNEYYLFWRELRFLHFVASMRERAEEALREVLTLAGELCGFTASVTAHGVYTPEAICEFMNQMQAGELSFEELTDIVLQQSSAEGSEGRRIV